MVMSVNTNVGAMIALQNLNATNAQLATTQNRINTGKSVATAKDNGAIWAIAQGQRAEIGALSAVKQSLDRGPRRPQRGFRRPARPDRLGHRQRRVQRGQPA